MQSDKEITQAVVIPPNKNWEQSQGTFQTASLFRLPAELRLQIYIDVMITEERPTYSERRFNSNELLRIRVYNSILGKKYYRDKKVFISQYSGLLLTSRQIYLEARLLPFEMADFEINAKHLSLWQASFTTEQKRTIRSLDVFSRLKGPRLCLPSNQNPPFFKYDVVPILEGLTGLKRLYVEITVSCELIWRDELGENTLWQEIDLAEVYVQDRIKEVVGHEVELRVKPSTCWFLRRTTEDK